VVARRQEMESTIGQDEDEYICVNGGAFEYATELQKVECGN